jgi:hypothetical protein
MIAYDLDGVLIADYLDYPNDNISEEQIKQVIPLFKPPGEFYILTGREKEMRNVTVNWLDSHGIVPIKLFHENAGGHVTGVHYKLQVLLDFPQITKFIESSERQVKILQPALAGKCEVIHFSTWIRNMLKTTYKL